MFLGKILTRWFVACPLKFYSFSVFSPCFGKIWKHCFSSFWVVVFRFWIAPTGVPEQTELPQEVRWARPYVSNFTSNRQASMTLACRGSMKFSLMGCRKYGFFKQWSAFIPSLLLFTGHCQCGLHCNNLVVTCNMKHWIRCQKGLAVATDLVVATASNCLVTYPEKLRVLPFTFLGNELAGIKLANNGAG